MSDVILTESEDASVTRAVYWQGMREVCRDIRRTPPHMTEWLEMRWRQFARFYRIWRVAKAVSQMEGVMMPHEKGEKDV